ncbi:MAG: ABC transporter permease [Bacteroidaceae bacterium]|nr:ABC transporter permease [Bacteroidaceae bacterium]
MSFTNLIKIAIKAILSNKGRSFLSMLGIIIGVGAVIVMMAIGQGSKQSIREEIQKNGTNMLTIRPGADMRGGVRLDPSAMQTLKQIDYETILSEAKFVNKVSPEVSTSGQAVFGSNNTTSTCYGESPDYLGIRLWEVEEGVFFTEEDVKKSAKVCIVGQTIVKELFPNGQDPVGKTIRFKNIPLRIIGVFKGQGYTNWGMDQDNIIVSPYTTVMKRLAAQTHFNSILCSAVTEELSEQAIEDLTEILRRTHKLKADDVDNFTIRSQQEWMETMSSTMDTITIILVVAAAFSLLVAGIGIMNIMLVSVTERTKEIGLRMSVGARGMDISNQFLIESILISLTGGVLGVLFGALLTWGCNAIIGYPAVIPMWSVIVSFAVCVAIGVGFGYFPAQKAARLDPIEAIRYE